MRSSRRMRPTTKGIKRFIAARTRRTSCVSTPKRNFTPWIVWQHRDRRSKGHRIERERTKHMYMYAMPSPRGSARRTDSSTSEVKTLAENSAKKQRGRPFPKGTSGNPAGKPCGARHRTTRAAELLLDGEARALTRKCIELAKEGDRSALRLCLERIIPPRRDRPPFLPPAGNHQCRRRGKTHGLDSLGCCNWRRHAKRSKRRCAAGRDIHKGFGDCGI